MADKVGFHLGNWRDGPDEGSKKLIAESKANSLLAMDAVKPDEILFWASAVPDGYLILRKHFGGGPNASGARVMDWANGQAEMVDNYLKFAPLRRIYESGRMGVKIFNEPNFEFEGFGQSEEAMIRYNNLFQQAASFIRQRFPNIKIIGFSLAPGNRDVYFTSDKTNVHYWLHGPEASKDNPTQLEINAAFHSCLTKDVKMSSDWFGVHVYPTPGNWDKPWLGKRFERYWKFMPKHMVENTFILEASVADDAGQDVRAQEMKLWLTMLKNYPNIKTATMWWLRPGDPTWERHFYTNPEGTYRPAAYTIINFNTSATSSPQPTPTPSEPTDENLQRTLDYEGLPLGIRKPIVADGEYYWYVKEFIALNPQESNGNINVYVRCFDENGNRVIGVPVVFSWPGGSVIGNTENKPPVEWGDVNFAMGPGASTWFPDRDGPGPYEVKVGTFKTEVAYGMGLPVRQHFSYKVVFQKVKAVAKPPEDDVPNYEDIGHFIVNSAWNKLGVSMNRDAYFFKYARKENLGRPLGEEYDVTYGKRIYRVQPYDKGIVFAEVANGQVLINTTNHVGWFVNR